MKAFALLVELTLMPLVAFVVGLALVVTGRRIAAQIQRRIGPPLLQPLYDIVKLCGKRTQVSHGLMHDIGIVVAVGGSIAVATMLPVPGMKGIADKAGLLTLAYMMMIPLLGLALGAGQCANPNGSIGIARALTALLAWGVPLLLVVFGVAWHFGSNNLADIAAAQQQAGFAGWGAVRMPLLALAGLFVLHAMLGMQPFEIHLASAEIAGGPMVEMGGKYLGGLLVMQCFQFYTAGVLYVTLFLGGSENWLTFLAKLFAVMAIPASLACAFPRYRAEDLLRLLWKWPVLLGLAGIWLVMR
jgi:NADH-quinone oxidoreductase subunit H